MKILFINNCHHRRGGADAVYFNTAKLFKDKGHEVIFFSQKNSDNVYDKNEDLFAENINYRELSFFDKIKKSKNYLYNKDAVDKLKILIHQEKPDIVNLHLFLGSLSVGILKVIKEANIPIAMTVHDYRLLCPANSFLDRNNNICEKCVDGNYIRCAVKKCSEGNRIQSAIITMEAYFRKFFIDPVDYIDKFIFVSEFIKDKHVSNDTRYNSKSEFLFNFTFDIKSPSQNINHEKYILFFGRISSEKGVEVLLKSIKGKKIKLKIVGDGILLKGLKKKYSSELIEFLGYKSGKELEILKQNSFFNIVPSVWYENNPLSILESYAYKKPVIASNVGGIPELVEDGKTGFLFKMGDVNALSNAIDKAINLTKDEYADMSANCGIFADENFNSRKHYQALNKIFSNLIVR